MEKKENERRRKRAAPEREGTGGSGRDGNDYQMSRFSKKVMSLTLKAESVEEFISSWES